MRPFERIVKQAKVVYGDQTAIPLCVRLFLADRRAKAKAKEKENCCCSVKPNYGCGEVHYHQTL